MMKKFVLYLILSLFFNMIRLQAQCPPPGFPAPSSQCVSAPPLCSNLTGFCNTLSIIDIPQAFPGCPSNSLNNPDWFSFVAGSTSINILVTPSNCASQANMGMQGAILEGGCDGDAVATQCGCTESPFVLSSGSLIIGQTYYVVFDGCAGNVCDYNINVTSGTTAPSPPSQPNLISGPVTVCPGITTDYCSEPATGLLNWTITPAIGVFTTPNGGECMSVQWTSPGSAQICVTASNPCFANPSPPRCTTVVSAFPPPVNMPPMTGCFGDCVQCEQESYCTSGIFTQTLQNSVGCDYIVRCTINILSPITNNLGQVTLCGPASYSICGETFNSSGFYMATCDSWQGCDSTVNVDLAILEPEAIISPPGTLGCGGSSTIVLNGGNSPAPLVPGGQMLYSWTGPGIVGVNNQPTVTVNAAGQYCLTVTHRRGTVSCTNTACVTVTSNAAVPQPPQITGGQTPCQGAAVTYTVTPVGTPAPTGYTWTTPNGEPVTQVSPTSVSVTWNNAAGGQLCVTANNTCGSSQPACIPITVTAVPNTPVVTGPAAVCANNTLQTFNVTNPQTGVTYNWTVPTGASVSGSGSSVSVNFSGAAAGGAQVCVTAQNACGTSTQACTIVTITALPNNPVMAGPNNACASGGPYPFNVTNVQTGITYTWTTPPGATVTGSGASVSVNFNGSSTGQVCVTASNACGNTPPVCQTVQVAPAPTASISGNPSFCQGSGASVDLTITLTGTSPWTVVYSNGSANTTINVTSSPHTISVNQAGAYTLVSVTGPNNCAGTVSGTATVTQNPQPTAALSGGGSLCQGSGQTVPLTITLTGTAPWTVNWMIGSTAQAPLIINSSPYTLPIGQAQAGNISLTSVTDGNNCTGTVSGSATVTVNTAPTVSNIQTQCNATSTSYTVSFTISGGNAATYSVTPLNGTLSGGVFTSNLINSGAGFSFVVSDANNCNPVTVEDNAVICNCITMAGDMDQVPINECGNGPVTATYDNTNEASDGNDVVVYILHNGNGVNIVPPILSTTTAPTVSFNPATMTYGTTYYLSAVVGNNDGSGGVDLTDDCLAVAQGTPITFYEIPAAVLSGSAAICQGDAANLTVNFTGVGPWSIGYTIGGGAPQTISGITSSTYQLMVSPAVSGQVCLVSMSDANCPGTASGCSNVTVNTGITLSNTDVVCNATNTAYTVTTTISGGDPASYFVTGATGTISATPPYIFTSDPMPTGVGFSITVDDANSCDPQTITQTQIVCDCDSDAGQMIATQQVICGNGPVTLPAATAIGTDADDIVLYMLHTSSSDALGTVIAVNNQPVFSFAPGNMNYGTPYYISSVVGSENPASPGAINLTDPCLSVAFGTPVIFYEVPTAALLNDDEICIGETAELIMDLTGDSPWDLVINGQPVTNINSTPYTYMVSPTVTTPYILTIVSDEHCADTVSMGVTVTVHNSPIVSNIDVNCNTTGTGFTVCFDISGGDPSCYLVSPNNGTLTGNQFCSNELPDQQGFVYNITDCHGCPAAVAEDPFVDCDCVTQAGDMTGAPFLLCQGEMTTQTYDPALEVLDGDDVVCFMIHTGNNVPITTNTTGIFGFLPGIMNYGQQYFISAIAGNNAGNGCADLADPCLSIGGSVPVTFFANPTATLNPGVDICEGQTATLSINLTGVGPWTITYMNAQGNQSSITTSANPASITVSPSTSTVYQLVSVSDANCDGTVSGSAIINVNTAPQGVNVVSLCEPTSTTYIVSFEIAGGDPATYNVTPAGNLAGNTFTSNPILSGTPYSFSVSDASGCTPDIVSGVLNCPCLSNAGDMSNTGVQVCIGETATVPATTGETTDPNDVLVYILHTSSNNQLGTILATSPTPGFTFNPTNMTAGQQYYISAVVANSGTGPGGINQNDPCLSVAPGTPVIFYPVPTLTISGTTAICEGDDATINISLTGTGPFMLTYLLNGVMNTVTVPINNLQITQPWTTTTTVTLVSIVDQASGCSNTSTQSATITVNPAVEAGTGADLAFCQDDATDIQLNEQLTGNDPGGVWTGPNNAVVPNGNLNASVLPAGAYLYTYTMDGQSPCPDDQAFVELVIHPEPVADAGPDQSITCQSFEANLGGNATTAGATYAWTGGNVDNPAAAQTGTTSPGVYTLTVETEFGCIETDQVQVNIDTMLPSPHISISDVSCFGKKDGFIVMDSITNGQPPYLCSFDDGPFTAQKQFTNLSAGEHTIVVSDANGCERTLVFSVKQPEEVTVAIEGSFEGDENTIDLGGSVVLQVITTPPFGQLDTIIWTPDSLIACPTCPSNEVSPTEQTTFSVMIEKGGCSDEDRLTVFVRKDHPVFVPNAFSPNEDGKNDVFGIHNNPKIANVKSFLIFNRWGETMYEHYNFVPEPTPDKIGWDGTHRGEKMNPAVFTWFAEIEFIDGVVEIFEGDLVLLR